LITLERSDSIDPLVAKLGNRQRGYVGIRDPATWHQGAPLAVRVTCDWRSSTTCSPVDRVPRVPGASVGA
jgi:hypothetical protein